jgi:hypothetical protein
MRTVYLAIASVAAFAGFAAIYTPPSSTNFLADPLDVVFARYLAEYGKSYSSKEEYEQRKAIFSANLKYVTEHNSRNDVSWTASINKFSDLTDEEFSKNFLGDNGDKEIYPEGE